MHHGVPVLLAVVCAVVSLARPAPSRCAALFSPGVAPIVDEADALVRQGRYREAKARLGEALKLERDRGARLSLRVRQCNLFLAAGKVDRGRELLRQLMTKSSDPVVLVGAARSLLYYPPVQRDEARRLLEQALRSDDANWDALVELGACNVFDDRLDDARSCYDRAIAAAPDRSEAYSGRADGACIQGTYDTAVADLTRAHELAPENADIMYRIGNAYLGSDLADRINQAFVWFERVLGAGSAGGGAPEHYAALMLVCFVRRTAGDAKPYYERLKQAHPETSAIAWADGAFHEIAGRPDQALACYEAAVTKNPRDWFAQFSRANVLAGRGNAEYVAWAQDERHRYGGLTDGARATEAYRALLAGAPAFPFAAVARTYLTPHETSAMTDYAPSDTTAPGRPSSDAKRRSTTAGRAMSSGMY